MGISFKVDGIPLYAATLLFMVWDWTSIEHSEEVKIIMLNRANRVLGDTTVSKGELSGSIFDTRIILQYAIKFNASAMIIAHNVHIPNTLSTLFRFQNHTKGLGRGFS